jgi:sec-independent protein translocase protein TatA
VPKNKVYLSMRGSCSDYGKQLKLGRVANKNWFKMALTDPVNILLVLGVLAVILIWGPQKIPELARSIGRARKEFDDASKGLTNPAGSLPQGVSASDPLIDTAQKLGINTQGKTRQEISDEIVNAAKSK